MTSVKQLFQSESIKSCKFFFIKLIRQTNLSAFWSKKSKSLKFMSNIKFYVTSVTKEIPDRIMPDFRSTKEARLLASPNSLACEPTLNLRRFDRQWRWRRSPAICLRQCEEWNNEGRARSCQAETLAGPTWSNPEKLGREGELKLRFLVVRQSVIVNH